MILRLFLLILLSIIPIIEMCIPMKPPEGVTQPPIPCQECNVDELLLTPVTTNTVLNAEDLPLVNGNCLQVLVNCQTTDNRVCMQAVLTADIPEGTSTIAASTMGVSQISVTLTCANDGTYTSTGIPGSSPTEEISGINCFFDTCAPGMGR